MSTATRPGKRTRNTAEQWAAYLAPPGHSWRLPVDAMLLALVLFAAFTFGGTEPWSQQLIALLAMVICVYTLAVSMVKPLGYRRVDSWTYLPIVLFLGLVLLQTLPLPAEIMQVISPGTYETRASMLADLDDTGSKMTLSLLPEATYRLLWALLPIVAVFVVCLHTHRSEAGVKRLCQILMLCGGVVALSALSQQAGGAGPRFKGIGEHLHSGPFLNHSHFGQFVNLGIGAAIGLMLLQVNRLFKKHQSPARVWAKLSKEREHFVVWIALSVIICGAVAVLLSMTRGGVVSLLAAGGIVGGLLARTGRGGGGQQGSIVGSDKAALLVALGIVTVAAALAFGFDRVYDRVATLSNLETAQGGRVQILQDLTTPIAKYPLLGSGFGTFEVVFPAYDSEIRGSLTTHAENEYAQMLLETGLLGSAFIAWFIGIVLYAAWRVMRKPTRSIDYLAFGLFFGMLAILVHSLSDFGQHVPAVAVMTAITSAVILNLAALHKVRLADDSGLSTLPSEELAGFELTASHMGPRWLRLGGQVLLAGLLTACGASALALEGPRKARSEFAAGQAIEERIYGPDPELIRHGDDERMIRRYAAAAELDPSVPRYAYLRDYFTWGLIGFDVNGLPLDLADDQAAKDEVHTLLARIDASRRAAPTYGPLHQLAGEARFFGLNEMDRGAELIALGHALTPHDPYAAFNAGAAKARLDDFDAARQHFEHAVQLSSDLRTSVVDMYVYEIRDLQAAYDFAAKDVKALEHLRSLATDQPGQEALVAQIDNDLRNILIQRAYADQPRPQDLAAMAQVHRRENELDQAVALYQRAIALDPAQVQWRLELGQLFADQGQPEQAVREARAILQLRPDSQGASRLLHEQVVYLGATSQTELPE